MAGTPEEPEATGDTQDVSAAATPRSEPKRFRKPSVHEVAFVSYPKLLFIWPLILAGIVFWPFTAPLRPDVAGAQQPVAAAAEDTGAADDAEGASAPARPEAPVSAKLAWFGWIYIWIAVLVVLTLGVDIDRNHAAFWIVVVAAIWILGLWLQDRQYTFFGDIYRWFANMHVQYNRSLGLALGVILLVPYVVMLIWARINDKWRITHNEFEHYSFGKMDDSLGRGAKTIRTSFPDVFELLLGLAGTLVVYNATGTKELRRIPHVMFLPQIRKRLNKILEKTAITAAQMEEEEDDDDV